MFIYYVCLNIGGLLGTYIILYTCIHTHKETTRARHVEIVAADLSGF